jgi:hypothetical protein
MRVQQRLIGGVTQHPKNYNAHPDEQVAELAASLKQHGQYRNIVIASDDVILAGHGVWLAAQKLEWPKIACVKMDFDSKDPRALKLLAADNTLALFSTPDDRALTELLKEIREFDEFGLEGTGFDDMMLTSLVMVTRPADEVGNVDHAAEWLGMPGYEPKETDRKYTILFRNDDDRRRFAETVGLRVGDDEKKTWSAWWPDKEKDDVKSVMVEG